MLSEAIRNPQGTVQHDPLSTAWTPQAYELTVVVPTRNERENIVALLTATRDALHGIFTEVIFVDDSDDDTPDVIRQAAHDFAAVDFAVRLEHRPKGPLRVGGLATAVELGIRHAEASYVAVIDADLQHPPAHLRRLYEEATKQDADIVIATRYKNGGSYEGLEGVGRRFFSVGLKWTAKLVFPDQLMRVSDPLGGFFLIRTDLVEGVALRPIGYKISLEVLVRSTWAKLVEVPYRFRKRNDGESKADITQGVQVLQHMARLLHEVPAAGRFWKYCAVGASGVLVNVLLFALLAHFNLPIWLCWLAGTEGSLLSNFALNNWLTWRDEQSSNGRLFARVARYHVVMAGSLLINLLLFTAAFFWLRQGIPAQLLAITGATFSSYWFARRWVFTSQGQPVASHTVIVAEAASEIDFTVALHRRTRPDLKTRLGNLGMAALLIAAIAFIAQAQMGGWLAIATLLVGGSLMLSQRMNTRQNMIMLLATITSVASIDYISWRFSVTNWANWWISIPLLVAEAFGVIQTVGLQVTVWPWPEPKIEEKEDPTQRPIFIFLPTVDEGEEVIGPSVIASKIARERYLAAFPHGRVSIVICNDGRVANYPEWESMERLAKRTGIQCVTREVGGGAKAGNIEFVRQQVGAVGDALIVIFDADEIAKPDCLLKMIKPFTDPTVGWVQGGQYYGNMDNPVANWAHNQQALFYQILCPGKAAQNAAFICGTNVMIRAAALDSIGGLPQDSVTEDFAASIALHPFWRSIFLNDELATGLGPMDLPAYLKQQLRWSTGTLGTFRKHWRDLFLPKRNGLSLQQRFQYFLACSHYLCGLRDLIYIVAPMMFLATGIPTVHGSTLNLFLWHFLPYWIASMASFWFVGRGVTDLRGVIIGFGSFPALLQSLYTVIRGRKGTFNVTAKHRATNLSLRFLIPPGLALVCCLIGFVLAFTIHGRQPASVQISVMWLAYTLAMLSAYFWLVIKDLRQDTVAVAKPKPVRVQRAWTAQLAPVWRPLAVAAVLMVTLGSALWVKTADAAHQPEQYVISTTDGPLFGISLSVKQLNTQPAVITNDLHTSLGVVGRTQTLDDRFDMTWANNLAAQHSIPWLTLQFGQFGADGKAPLTASLPAIANGVDDNAIRRWATEMRDYGHPVLLTILLHVDRDWSVSSGVANGGIPEDAPRAWQHVQAVFRSVGATNVAWVWSPADPAHDQDFAPPANTIDAVLLSMISYPHTKWANPATTIAAVQKRYPTKPLLVEVSADGTPQAKAQWLTQVGQAVEHVKNIYALIYHEGTPDITETAAADHSWSLTSDQLSLQVMLLITQHLNQSAPATPSASQALCQPADCFSVRGNVK